MEMDSARRRAGAARGKAVPIRRKGEKDAAMQEMHEKIAMAKRIKHRRILGFVIAEVLVLTMIFGYAYLLKQYNKIQRPDYDKAVVENTDLTIEKVKAMEGYWNIAVFGVDSTNQSVGKGANSDVIIIVSINRGNGEIRMVSVYRDTYLNTKDNSYNKINNAYAIGGPELAVQALNKNLDLNITDYVTFNWKSVAIGVDALGGVDIDITKSEFRYINSYITATVKGTGLGSVHLKSAGMNHLDGVQAVAYARLRYMDSDFERTERQRRVIKLLFEKAKKADFATLNGIFTGLLPMVATNLTWQDGIGIIQDIGRYNIAETTGFPFTMGNANMGRKGSNVVPKTLESNVLELHKFLFADEDYAVSDTVRRISKKISDESGMYNAGGYTAEDYSRGAREAGAGSGSGAAAETTRAKDDSEGTGSGRRGDRVIEDEEERDNLVYETDSAGNIIRVYETNSQGDIVGTIEHLTPESSAGTKSSSGATQTVGPVPSSSATASPTTGGSSPGSSSAPPASSTAATMGPSSTTGTSTAPGSTTAATVPTTTATVPSTAATTAPTTAATVGPTSAPTTGASPGPGGTGETVPPRPGE